MARLTIFCFLLFAAMIALTLADPKSKFTKSRGTKTTAIKTSGSGTKATGGGAKTAAGASTQCSSGGDAAACDGLCWMYISYYYRQKNSDDLSEMNNGCVDDNGDCYCCKASVDSNGEFTCPSTITCNSQCIKVDGGNTCSA